MSAAAEKRSEGARAATRRAVFLAVVVALAVAAALIAWRAARPSTGSGVAFDAKPIGRGVVERSVSATGAVKALVTVEVGSQLSGLISDMKVDFNDRVKEGELLAVIDRGPFEAKVAAATAHLAIAQADVIHSEAAIEKATTQLAQHRRDVARQQALEPRGISSQRERDQVETQNGVASSELAMAKAQLDAARAAVAQRQADLREAQIDLDRTLIRSPINGVVIDRKMQTGQTVTAGYQTPVLFQIAQDLSQIVVMAQVDEADIGTIRSGAPVSFSVEAFPDETFEGRVAQVRLAATKIAGVVTYTVVILAVNPDLRLFPEMTATVRIAAGRRDDVLFAPNEALRFRPPDKGARVERPDRDYGTLWKLEDGALKEAPVQLGLRGDSVTEILEGPIDQGDSVAFRAKPAAPKPAS